ncbi:unnamed protein product [Boreogadus saida]
MTSNFLTGGQGPFSGERELVTELCPRRPQLVEQKALPLLWCLLGPSCGSMRRATTSPGQALHDQMGPGLAEGAASQPPNVHTVPTSF